MDGEFDDVPDELWKVVAPLLPKEPEKPKRGRPPVSNRRVFSGLVYRLRTGCQWKALGSQFGSGSTCHRRFQAWVALGIFATLWEVMLKFYDRAKGIDLKWTALDSATVKAPKGGTTLAPTPLIGQRAAPSATF